MVPPCPREWWDGELTAPAKDPSQFAQLSTVRQAPELNQCTSQNGNMDFAVSPLLKLPVLTWLNPYRLPAGDGPGAVSLPTNHPSIPVFQVSTRPFADSKNPNLRTQELADLASPGWGSQPYSGAKLCSVKWLVPSLGLGFTASPLVYAAMTVDEKM